MENMSQPLQQLLANAIALLPSLIAALVIFIAALVAAVLLSRAAQRAMERRQLDLELTLLLGKITRWGIIVLGTAVALQQVNFNLSAFLAGLGILGFTIGFAIQDVSKNFVAGLLLLLQKPFNIGHTIEVADYTGTVTAIDLRATELYTLDGKHVLIPNADVFTSPIVNFSRTTRRRIKLTVGVAYDSDLEAVQELTRQTISDVEGVLPDPEPAVIFDNFGASSIDFSLYYWIDVASLSVFDGTAKGVKAIKAAFEKSGIDIPYPIQHFYMESSKQLQPA